MTVVGWPRSWNDCERAQWAQLRGEGGRGRGLLECERTCALAAARRSLTPSMPRPSRLALRISCCASHILSFSSSMIFFSRPLQQHMELVVGESDHYSRAGMYLMQVSGSGWHKGSGGWVDYGMVAMRDDGRWNISKEISCCVAMPWFVGLRTIVRDSVAMRARALKKSGSRKHTNAKNGGKNNPL